MPKTVAKQAFLTACKSIPSAELYRRQQFSNEPNESGVSHFLRALSTKVFVFLCFLIRNCYSTNSLLSRKHYISAFSRYDNTLTETQPQSGALSIPHTLNEVWNCFLLDFPRIHKPARRRIAHTSYKHSVTLLYPA